MPTTQRETVVNRLLAALPREEWHHLLANGETVELRTAETLAEAGEHIRHVYFPAAGHISLTTGASARAGLEVGLVGNEGMLGVSLLLRVPVAPLRAVAQEPGPALRLDAIAFARELEHCPALRRSLERYLYVVYCQLAQSALCNRFHVVEARLARRLLMTRDRAQAEEFHATHQLLAAMLGVRRVGITKAAIALQRRGLIRYRRGDVTILDRAGLETASCDCYHAEKAIYSRIMGKG